MSDFLDRVQLEQELQQLSPDAECLRAQRDRLHAALGRLLRAFPRLSAEFSNTEQQAALRVALCALEECGG